MNKKVVFLPYDMDTAIGINNEGALVLDYNLEDTDQIAGADVFNGQDSVLWCNLRECFPDELKAMYQQLRSSGALSYSKVEQAFEEHQSKWPEAIFNEDAFFKYIQPLIDDGDDSYLSMLQGSKQEQRKWWLYNRFKYIDSKYNAGDSLTDRIQLRGYQKSNITLTPYADIYASIKWGSYLDNQRAPRNVAKVMVCPMDNLNDTEIYIYSASQLASLGDLSGLKVGFADFHNATKLQELILGSTVSGYSNLNLRSVNVGNLKLLRKIDVRNCTGLGTFADQKTVDLSGCTGIEEVYFDGTSILGVELPNGGFLKKLHLPGTITNLTVKNQNGITEFVCPDFSHISTLNLENTGSSFNISTIVDSLPYISVTPEGSENPASLCWYELSNNAYVRTTDTTVTANKQYYARGTRVRLFNFRWDFQTAAAVQAFLDKFDGMSGIDQNGDNTSTPQIYATVHLPSATGDEIDAITARYPDITVDADVASYYLRYYDETGNTLLYTETVQKNQNGSWATQPSKASTAQYTYTFLGWSLTRNSSQADANSVNNITQNTNVYAAYRTVVRTYTVTFKNSNGTVLQTVSNVPYGGTATYTGSTPAHPTDSTNMQFTGFNPTGANIIGNTDCIAQYMDTRSPVIQYLNRTLTSYTSGQDATKIASYAFYNMSTLQSVETYATTIESYAFNGCSNIESMDLKAASGVVAFNVNGLSSKKLMNIFVRSSNTASITGSLQTQFLIGKGAIYVPTDKVDTYKVASGWSSYKNNIFSIDDYPVTNFDTIKDTLSEMCTKLANGTASYDIGDIKTIDLGAEGQIRIQVAAKNVDELSTGGSNAAYTWIALDLLNTNHRMNPSLSGTTEGTGAIGGWGKCEMRTYLNTTIWALIPAELQAVIKEVKKYSCIYDTSSTKVSNDVSNDKLWIPSTREAFNNNTYETQGPNYVNGTFPNNMYRMRYKGNSNGIAWSERSANNTQGFRAVNTNGAETYYGASSSYSILLGFCT